MILDGSENSWMVMIHYLKNKVGVVDFANAQGVVMFLLHFVAFFHVASLFSTGVDNKKVGVDNEKALELTNNTIFHRGRQRKNFRTTE